MFYEYLKNYCENSVGRVIYGAPSTNSKQKNNRDYSITPDAFLPGLASNFLTYAERKKLVELSDQRLKSATK